LEQPYNPGHARGGFSRHTGGVISPRIILAAVNFSDASHSALVLAAWLARRTGAQPHVLFVEDPLLDAAAGRGGIDLAASSRAELRRLIWHEWPAPKCSPRLHVVAGSEVDVVLEVAREQGADLIVVGDRPISRLERVDAHPPVRIKTLSSDPAEIRCPGVEWPHLNMVVLGFESASDEQGLHGTHRLCVF